jgi:hypothetical protein
MIIDEFIFLQALKLRQSGYVNITSPMFNFQSKIGFTFMLWVKVNAWDVAHQTILASGKRDV